VERVNHHAELDRRAGGVDCPEQDGGPAPRTGIRYGGADPFAAGIAVGR
jgi:hypothetical protein